MTQPTPRLPPSRPKPRRSPPLQAATPPLRVVPVAAPVPAGPPEAAEAPAITAQSVGRALGCLGLLLSASHEGTLPWNVTGAFGGSFSGHRFALTSLDDAQAMLSELPAHLAAPTVWDAVLRQLRGSGEPTDQDASPVIAWTAGYAAARRYFFTNKGAFIPLHLARRQDVPCPYSEPASQQAFLTGVGAYLTAVRLKVQDQQLSSATSLPPRYHP